MATAWALPIRLFSLYFRLKKKKNSLRVEITRQSLLTWLQLFPPKTWTQLTEKTGNTTGSQFRQSLLRRYHGYMPKVWLQSLFMGKDYYPLFHCKNIILHTVSALFRFKLCIVLSSFFYYSYVSSAHSAKFKVTVGSSYCDHLTGWIRCYVFLP